MTEVPTTSTTLAPCNAWSPWINENKPYLKEGDLEFKTLSQLQDKYSFCLIVSFYF